MSEKLQNQKPVRKPANVFKTCPCCASPNLIKVVGQLLCGYCDWTSVHSYVDARIDMQKLERGCGGQVILYENVTTSPGMDREVLVS